MRLITLTSSTMSVRVVFFIFMATSTLHKAHTAHSLIQDLATNCRTPIGKRHPLTKHLLGDDNVHLSSVEPHFQSIYIQQFRRHSRFGLGMRPVHSVDEFLEQNLRNLPIVLLFPLLCDSYTHNVLSILEVSPALVCLHLCSGTFTETTTA